MRLLSLANLAASNSLTLLPQTCSFMCNCLDGMRTVWPFSRSFPPNFKGSSTLRATIAPPLSRKASWNIASRVGELAQRCFLSNPWSFQAASISVRTVWSRSSLNKRWAINQKEMLYSLEFALSMISASSLSPTELTSRNLRPVNHEHHWCFALKVNPYYILCCKDCLDGPRLLGSLRFR